MKPQSIFNNEFVINISKSNLTRIYTLIVIISLKGDQCEMFKEIKNSILAFALLGVSIFLLACSPSYETFVLRNMENELYDPENAQVFIVAPKEEPNKVTINYNDSLEYLGKSREVKQKLKDVKRTGEEIIIKTIDETFTFEKLSDSVAVNENGVWYDINFEITPFEE